MYKYVPLILFLLHIISCDKAANVTIDNKPTNVPIDSNHTVKYDTAMIGGYFPVYPNSYWIYLDLNGDTIVHKTDSAYTLWPKFNPINNPYDTVKYFISKYDTMPVKKYSLYVGSKSYHESGWRKILPDSLYKNNLFDQQYILPNSYYSGLIQTIDTSLEINKIQYDSVIIVLEYYGPSIGKFPYGKTYYAKNIGIIKSESWDLSGNTKISEKCLIKYKIGR
ncbi:MAG: hypothetical protein IPJ43_11235 [Saprospiraceae bacterium]|nr:hypothetical protein [Saprospiraceae bacterium]